ncbi:MAG: YggS family pyridoxal phosphate-dependent enzyme [Bacteroidota bacterium]
MQIADNLSTITQKIAEAAEAAGRDPQEVKLIAVSKTKPMSLIEEAYEAGQLDFGENRVQELREKHPALPEARWHMIGSLQRNKVKYIAPFIHLIHSVDSRRLLVEINKQAEKHTRNISCLLQLNISEEDTKSGMDEAEAKEILAEIDQFPFVKIEGLMGMAAFVSDEETIRNQFRRLRMAAVAFEKFSHDRIQMRELSMGMSGDFEIAIAEGATMVRVGSAVFGSRNYP